MADPFALDPTLAADTIALTRLDLCEVRLMNDARFPWLVLVPARAAAAEIIDLDGAERGQLMEEITHAARALKETTGCRKLNVGALGNIVRQLHVHVVARFAEDAAWPGPVWGAGQRLPYAPPAASELIARLQGRLGATQP